jgi:hypothetical protein
MRTSRLAKGLVTAGLALTASGLAGCGPDYSLFDVYIHFPQTSTPTDRQDIEACKITIVDTSSGKAVLQDHLLDAVYNSGGTSLQAGCASAITPRIVGHFSYSTSRSGGTLNFTVNAYDNNGKVVHGGTKDGNVAKYPPEVLVDIEMTKK